MRPLRLEMEGFATFRDRTVLNFDELDLIAFVGATGAGKSTIIDALTFALYGSVARYDNANVVAPVIHQLSTEAKVRLDFEVADQHYVAVRVVRRRGSRSKAADAATGSSTGAATGVTSTGASTKEARLERLVGEESVEVLAGNVRELDAAVSKLLGLDFGQFTRTVVLPQGQFAQFLKDEPSSRQKLLRSLLDLDIYHRMGVVAREEAKKAAQQAEALESELIRQSSVTDETLAALAERVEALTALRIAVGAGLDEMAAVDHGLDPVREQVKEIDARLRGLALVKVPDDLAEADRLLADSTSAVSDLESELAEARNNWEQRQSSLQAGPDKAELHTTLNQLDQLSAIESEAASVTATTSDLATRLAEATATQTKLEVEASRTQARLTELRQSADAAVWVAQLSEGEPCPVCRQTVDHLPDHLPDAALAEAQQLADSTAKTTADQARLISETQGTLRVATDQQSKLQKTAEGLRVAVGEQDRAKAETALAEIAVQADGAKAAYEQMTKIERRLTELKVNREQLAARAQEWNVEFSRQRDEVTTLEPPTPQHQSLFDDWTVLAQWASESDADLTEQRALLADKGKELAGRRKEILSDLGLRVQPFGFDSEPESMLEAVAVARSEAAGQLDAARERQQEQQRLRDRIDGLSADREINRVLGQHLSASGFEGWLLNEALDNIVGRATRWLLNLSGGSYSLAINNREFAIIDHNNADEQRDVRTLSGGETFLTSLSLALALADSIAELAPVDAPRLESMFLDEGFGTLDGATLDVVASAIEELASTGRMIGIVTHVRDLAERLPARFEVSKSATGSSVALVQV